MPGLLPRGSSPSCSPLGGIWSRQRDALTTDQLQKFWSDLPHGSRQQLLRIDKQTLFEQARKNFYCSRCNGMLLEGFSQIVMYGKSLQQVDAAGLDQANRMKTSKTQTSKGSDDRQDPSVHPWGGLIATREGTLTLLDCFLKPNALKPLQNVFDCAKVRERDREMLYPDACGGGGRGWTSQGMANYGRGHGTRETCALQTNRLVCEQLVKFWDSLGDEMRLSLLRMKEEDFIERLMYRFDSKRFCRDCRRNVIRELKELKELKRMRREICCTKWFCVADTAFQYEVTEDTVQADWHQTFKDTVGTYHHFEWGVGTAEGKCDILDFEDVGTNENVEVNGLDLSGLSACFIMLRAWKLDGRCNELSVKAHALNGQQCVHRRIVIGDGYVTITEGESIRRFFEHAEEAEEEEDDDAMDKDGNEYDGEGARSQKHAKSPELAREFLLDAATVIFKEQVEKTCREGMARQNAHFIFVSLALRLLEERLHVACKEIITWEKQIKLLEEEENEKREEEQRKERRRTKEREKKNRRKERLKGKERDRERNCTEPASLHFDPLASTNDSSTSTNDESPSNPDSGDSNSDPGDNVVMIGPASPDILQEKSSDGLRKLGELNDDNLQHEYLDKEDLSSRDGNDSFIEQSKSSRRKLRFNKDVVQDQSSKWYDKCAPANSNGTNAQDCESNTNLHGCVMAPSRIMSSTHRQLRGNAVKANARSSLKFGEKFHSANIRNRDRPELHSCSCSPQVDYKAKDRYHNPTIRSNREAISLSKKETVVDTSRVFYRSNKFIHGCYLPDNGFPPRGKVVAGINSRDVIHTKQVWEPTDSRNKCQRSSSNSVINSRVDLAVEQSLKVGFGTDKDGSGIQLLKSHGTVNNHCLTGQSEELDNVDAVSSSRAPDNGRKISNESVSGIVNSSEKGYVAGTNFYLNGPAEEANPCSIVSSFSMANDCDPIMSSSSSENCSSCLSEGDSSTSFSSGQNAESSSTSDSEDTSPQCNNGHAAHLFPNDVSDGMADHAVGADSFVRLTTTEVPGATCDAAKCLVEDVTKADQCPDNVGFGYNMAYPQQHVLSIDNPTMRVPSFLSPTFSYQEQSATCWSAVPTNGFIPFHQSNHYMFPDPFGYGMGSRSSDISMPYNQHQHYLTTPPSYNVGQHHMYRTLNGFDATGLKNQATHPEMHGTQKMIGIKGKVDGAHTFERPSSERQAPCRSALTEHSGNACSNDRSRNSSSSFSLFHFGGPLAGVAGYTVKPGSPKEEKDGLSSNPSAVEVDVICPKEEMEVEEYTLFATKNAGIFPFF